MTTSTQDLPKCNDETFQYAFASKNKSIFFASLICFLAAFFYAYDYFIQVAPSVITSELMDFFNIRAAGLGILSAMFFYSYTIMQIPAGMVLDRWGARISLSFAVFISGLGLGLFAISPHFWLACLGRLLIGGGSAFAFLSSLFLISRWFPARYFPWLAGIVQMFSCIGSITGQAPLAILVDHFNWQYVLSLISLGTMVLALIYYVVIRDGKKVITNEHRPVGVLSLFKNRSLMLIASIGFICWIPVGGIAALWGVPYLMTVYGVSNVVAGKIVALFWIALAVSSPLIGLVAAKTKNKLFILIVPFLIGAVAILMLNNALHFSIAYMYLAFFLLGVTAGLQSLTFALTSEAVSPEIFSTASGMINMAAILGGGLAQTITGFILSALWGGQRLHGAPIYSPFAYHVAFSFILVFLVIGVVLSQCYTRRISKHSGEIR